MVGDVSSWFPALALASLLGAPLGAPTLPAVGTSDANTALEGGTATLPVATGATSDPPTDPTPPASPTPPAATPPIASSSPNVTATDDNSSSTSAPAEAPSSPSPPLAADPTPDATAPTPDGLPRLVAPTRVSPAPTAPSLSTTSASSSPREGASMAPPPATMQATRGQLAALGFGVTLLIGGAATVALLMRSKRQT